MLEMIIYSQDLGMRDFLFPSVFHLFLSAFIVFFSFFWLWSAVRYSFCHSDTISRTERLIKRVTYNFIQIAWCQTPDNLSLVQAQRLFAGAPPRKRQKPWQIQVLKGAHVCLTSEEGSLKADPVSSLWLFFLQANFAASIISLPNMFNFFILC